MKKVILFLGLLLTSLTLFSANPNYTNEPPININGFGILKLGVDVDSIIKTIPTPVDYNTYLSKVYGDTVNNTWFVAVNDTNNIERETTMWRFCSMDNRVKVYFIGYIEVTKDIKLTEVTLSFFNGKLFSIETGRCLDKILTIKYGEPKIDFIKTPHTFQNGYGATFIKTDVLVDYDWKTTPDIKLLCFTSFRYNDSGELNYTGRTFLSSKNIEEIIEANVAQIKKTKEEKKLLIEKSKLNDF